MNFQAPAFHCDTFSHYPSDSFFSSPVNLSHQQSYPYRTTSVREGYIQASEVVILEPQSFEEVPPAVQILRNNKVVVLNLAHMMNAEAQRSIDFIAGGAYMCQGSLEKIDANIFLLTPQSTNIRVEASQAQTATDLE
ncbi:cell division protein SepF [Leptolyngbya sp. BL0902]|uniref:cell division protein SepF n=1 Tax=Leptolyngbya sp. BL0902 TaxID=1115757 RepID=UPI0018E72DCB|nr:cell division protein SepF [Leptolyngbya sp. BL0902]QQE64055.1 cell division protein SepF [Leptolyngbya sp. BL0902]